ncbi:MAG: single-stranded DNA-binding protein [Methylococcales bacterium]|nr:single-stranded DNA-binding protein [Methylococcales bacterium]
MLNKVMLIGNLGADPEVRYMSNGDTVTSVRIATSRRWKDRNTGEQREEAEWHRITFFNIGNFKLAEIAGEYLKKGSKIYVEGRLKTSKYQKNGQDHYSTDIIADQMQMLDSRAGGTAEFGQQATNAAPQATNAAPQANQNFQQPQQAQQTQQFNQPTPQQNFQQPQQTQQVHQPVQQQGYQTPPINQPVNQFTQQPQTQQPPVQQSPVQQPPVQQPPVQQPQNPSFNQSQPVQQPANKPSPAADEFVDDVPF